MLAGSKRKTGIGERGVLEEIPQTNSFLGGEAGGDKIP
jgi:hypothetical protein